MASFDSIVDDARGSMTLMGENQENELHSRLLNLLRRLKRSALESKGHIEKMEKADRLYQAFRLPDEQDKKAKERGEPEKIIFPVSFAQAQTSLAALMAITDKNPFFQLTSRQPQYFRNSKLMELELDYQLEQAGWTLIRYQWFKNMLKYGFSPLFTGFERQTTFVRRNMPIPIIGQLFPWFTTPQDVETVGYEGVWFELNDPYNFKWDPACSVGEPKKWQFCFNTFQKSKNELDMMAKEEDFFNLDQIPNRTRSMMDNSNARERNRITEDTLGFLTSSRSIVKGGDAVIVDSMYVKLVPKEYGLSELDRMQIWQISMANEAVVIQARPNKHEHGQFPISVIEYDPDRHLSAGNGQVATIDGMQRLFNWLVNTHIDNVRKVMNDVLIVDPTMIELEDINQRKPVWRLKATARGRADMAVKQLQLVDVTRGHIELAMMIQGLTERTTGATSGLQGVGEDKVRTATENTYTMRNALGRMGLLAKLNWDQGVRGVGQQMIQNTQQFLSANRFLKISGGMAQSLGVDINSLPGQMFEVTPDMLQGMFSISLIDATTPSDKLQIAGKLQEILFATMGNPMSMQIAMQVLGIDLSQVATQMLMGYNIRNTTDFVRPPTPDQQKEAMMIISQLGQAVKGQPPRGANVQVMPDELAMNAVQRGNMVPVGGANGMGAYNQ